MSLLNVIQWANNKGITIAGSDTTKRLRKKRTKHIGQLRLMLWTIISKNNNAGKKVLNRNSQNLVKKAEKSCLKFGL